MSIDWAEKSSPPIDNGKGAKCVRALLVLLKNSGIIRRKQNARLDGSPLSFVLYCWGNMGLQGFLAAAKEIPENLGCDMLPVGLGTIGIFSGRGLLILGP